MVVLAGVEIPERRQVNYTSEIAIKPRQCAVLQIGLGGFKGHAANSGLHSKRSYVIPKNAETKICPPANT
jgi:hypothetical protein